MQSLLALGLLVACLGTVPVLGRPEGPPTGAATSLCDTMLPAHGSAPSSGHGNYIITTNIPTNAADTGYDYEAGRTYLGWCGT